uniref:AI-2E family transporter n=1 Tax=Magnetococcus massalia (strain MO-1) TaxID=451514 RepID=A0A1S7LH18_MAGMO|nr:Conserved membrane protein of unknown function [Candidatus Magnetococcus massalia]
MPHHPIQHPYEEGFLNTLVVIALSVLIWLFYPFIPGLFFAIFLAASTYRYYEKLLVTFKQRVELAAFAMALLVFLFVVSPVIYLLISSGLRVGYAALGLKDQLAEMIQSQQLKTFFLDKLSLFPLPNEAKDRALSTLIANREEIAIQIGDGVMFLFQNFAHNSSSFLASTILVSIALFFFYRDGPKLLQHIRILTPLRNQYDDIIFLRFNRVATTLVLSTLGIALLQGSIFALITAFLDLPWFYLGLAIAITSFIPVVGPLIVWAPVAYYLYSHDQIFAALLITFSGLVLIGFVIDNLVRPLMITWLSRHVGDAGHTSEEEQDKVLNHTFLTTLATFGGVMNFGVLGLFFGPMLAAIAITIIDLYRMTHQQQLDHS